MMPGFVATQSRESTAQRLSSCNNLVVSFLAGVGAAVAAGVTARLLVQKGLMSLDELRRATEALPGVWEMVHSIRSYRPTPGSCVAGLPFSLTGVCKAFIHHVVGWVCACVASHRLRCDAATC